MPVLMTFFPLDYRSCLPVMTVLSSPITAGVVSLLRTLVHYVANAHRELEGAMPWEDIIDVGVVYPNGEGRCIQVFYSSATLVTTC